MLSMDKTLMQLNKTRLSINQMNMHTHKQAAGNALLDGQSLLGVVSAPFPSSQKVLLQSVGCANLGCPRLTESLITTGFTPKGLSLSGGTSVPRDNEVRAIITGG